MKKYKRLIAAWLAICMVLPMCLNVYAQQTTVKIEAVHTQSVSDLDWIYPVIIAEAQEDSPRGAMNVYWDSTNLYFGVEYANANTANLTINGVEKAFDLDPENYSAVFTIPLSDVYVKLVDYGVTVPFSINLSDGTQVASLENAEIQMLAADKLVYDLLKDNSGNALISGDFTGKGTGVATIDTATGTTSSFVTNINGLALPENANLLMTQTIKVEEMPVTEAKFYGQDNATYKSRTTVMNGYSFVIGDRITTGPDSSKWGNTIFCTLHNVGEGKLSLVVVTDYEAAEKDVIIDLGVSVGDEFTLDTLWKTDDTLVVSVNGVVKAEVKDASFLNNQCYGSTDCVWLLHQSVTAGTTKMTVKEVQLLEAGYTSITDEITSDKLKMLVGDLSAVVGDIELPTTVQSECLGSLPITWKSSNEEVISNVGRVTRPTANDETVTLTASVVGGVELGSVSATVVKAPPVVQHYISAYSTADASAIGWTYPFAVGTKVDNAPSGALNVYWDKDNLYIGVEYANATEAAVTANGVNKTYNLGSEATTVVLAVPMRELNVNLVDYGISMPFTITLSDGTQTVSLENAEIQLLAADKLVYDLLKDNSGNALISGDFTGKGTGTATIDTDTGTAGSYVTNINGLSLPENTDILMTQTIKVEEMPVTEAKFYGQDNPTYKSRTTVINSYGFVIGDRITNGPDSSKWGNTVFCTLHNVGEGRLSLVVVTDYEAEVKDVVVDLGVSVGEQFTLETLWKTDDTLVVSVNGVVKAEVKDASFLNNQCYGSTDCVWIRHQSVTAGTTKMTVTNVQLLETGYQSIKDEITPEKLQELVGDLSQVRGNITLPTTVHSEILGELPVLWTSSDETVISNTGKVIRSEVEDKNVILTANIVNGVELGSVSATVLQALGKVQDFITAYNTADSGAIVWTYPVAFVAEEENAPTGGINAYWDKDKLYIGLNYTNANKLTLNVNGVTKKVELTENATSATAVVELVLAELGMTNLDYNDKVLFQATLSNSTGKTTKIGATDVYVHFCLKPTQTYYKFPDRINTGAVKNFDFQTESGKYVFDTATHGTNAIAWNYLMGMAVQNNVLHTTHDMYIQQTICVEAMPETSYVYGGTQTVGGYSFYIGDRTGGDYNNNKSLLCTVMNNGGSLTLYVSDNSENGYTAVDLNRKLGDVFSLGTQWNKDGSLDIFVDGIYKQTLPSVTKSLAGASNNLVLAYTRQADLSDEVKFTISNVAIYNAVPMSIEEDAKIGTQMGEADRNAVRGDITLPQTIVSDYLGTLNMVWNSSNPDVVSTEGKVTRPESADEKVTLTAAAANAGVWKSELGTVIVTVKKATPAASELIVADHTSDSSAIVWDYSNGIVGTVENAPIGAVAAYWDKDNLYVGIEYSGADILEIDANGKTITVNLLDNSSDVTGVTVTGQEGISEIQIPLNVLGKKLLDYGETISFTAVLKNSQAGTTASSSPEEQGVIQLVVGMRPIFDMILDGKGHVTGDTRPGLVAGFTLADGAAKVDTTDTAYHTIQTVSLADIVHDRDMLLEQTIYVEELPVTEAKFYGANKSNGYSFYVINAVPNPTGASGSYGELVYCTLHHVGDNKLQMVVCGGDSSNWHVVDLGVNIGKSFKLGTLWMRDGSVAVYVDGRLIGTYADVTYEAAYQGSDIIALNYQAQAEGQAKIQISDVVLSRYGYSSIKEEATASAVFGGEIPVMVEDDLSFPVVFNSAYLGTLPLTWSTSDENFISANGTVTRPTGKDDQKVDISAAIVGGKKLWTITSTVKAADTPSPETINAAFTSTPITVDGIIQEKSWILNTSVIYAGREIGRFGVQWDLNNLYLAIETDDISNAALKLGINTVDLSKSNKATSGSITEIEIPLSELGVEIADYNETIAVELVLGEGTYSGRIVLTSVDWFDTDNAEHRFVTLTNTTNGTVNQGIQKLEDGYYLYDHYDAGGNNPGNASSYVYFRWPKADVTKPTTVPLWPVDETYLFQFDFQATSMPVYSAQNAGYDIRLANYGVCWSISGHRNGASADYPSDVTLFGLLNNGSNLMFVVNGSESLEIIDLDKKVGDLFRIGVAVDAEGNLTLFIDGKKVHTFEHAEKLLTGMVTYNEDGAIFFNLIRNGNAAQSDADNFDVYMTNCAFGLYYGEELLDSLTFDTIKADNTDRYEIASNLNLVSTISNKQLINPMDLTWESSLTDVIASDGTVTRPEEGGQLVTLTATMSSGKSKSIQVYVKGKTPSDAILTVYRDTAPAQAPGIVNESYLYTLDADNRSIVFNLGSVQPVNVVKLTDGDTVARLHPDVLELWVSNDNVTFSQVKNFKLLHDGVNWYLYDFDASAQYIKVHCTHYDSAEADFTGPLAQMITVYHESDFGANGGSFETESTVSVTNNSDISKRDSAWLITLEASGAVTLKEDKSDIRFYLNGELLYHYFDGQNYQVRIPVIAAGASVTLNVKSGNENAMDISNKEYVHEMVYGTREVWNANSYTGNRIARTMTMSNGVVIGIDCTTTGTGMVQQFSYDGGQSWTAPVTIEPSVDWMTNASGFMYDSINDRIYFCGYDATTTPAYTTRLIYTDDCGQTWHRGYEIGQIGSCYVDGIELIGNDGEGPNVDFALGLGAIRMDENGARVGLEARIVYSKDGGNTWQASDSTVKVVPSEEGVEMGLSENSLYQLPNGTIVMYVRWQEANSYHFAVSYSYDDGVTWTESVVKSEVYTVNTNPVFMDYNGTPILLWSGNSALGGTSYRRIPLSIGYSPDMSKLMSIENIQDLYARYSLQGLDTATQNQATNPHISHNHDDLLITWFNNFVETLYMRVEDFDDYFYKTKGAYDSFEGRTPKYEGWAPVYGSVRNSDVYATDGQHSMFVSTDTAAARSIPSVSNGQISMDLYLPANANFKVELQSAFSLDGVASPVILEANNGVFAGVALKTGWNEIRFDLSMKNGRVSVFVNGTEGSVTFNKEIGDYICFVHIQTAANTQIYLDDFMVIDNDVLTPLSAGEKPNEITVTGSAIDTKVASVTAPEGGWVEGENTFTVAADVACVVAVSNDGGVTYTRLTATAVEGGYAFTADLTADSQIAVVVAGDANGDGKITNADAGLIKAVVLKLETADALMLLTMDVNNSGTITNADTGLLIAVALGLEDLSW